MGQSVESCAGSARFFARVVQFAGLFLVFSLAGACDSKRDQAEAQRPLQKIWEEFSGEKALAHVQAIVDFGPRPPGTEAIEKTRSYLTKQLESAGWKVTRQAFDNETPRGKVEFVNLIA